MKYFSGNLKKICWNVEVETVSQKSKGWLTEIPYVEHHSHKDVVHQVKANTISKYSVPQHQQVLHGELSSKQQAQPPSAHRHTYTYTRELSFKQQAQPPSARRHTYTYTRELSFKQQAQPPSARRHTYTYTRELSSKQQAQPPSARRYTRGWLCNDTHKHTYTQPHLKLKEHVKGAT